MKRLFVHPLIICSVLLLIGCAQKQKDEVVVIEKTKSYHTDVCFRVNMANIKWMTREKAKAMNFKACPGCQPDRGLVGLPDRQN